MECHRPCGNYAVESIYVNKSAEIKSVENLLYAGSSAFLISLAHLYPGYWYVSLFALIPFLWRVVRLSLLDSFYLGAMLGTLVCLATLPISCLVSLSRLLSHLAGFVALFALYGLAVNKVARYAGINAVLLAALWVPVEYLLSNCDHLSSIFVFAETDSAILVRISSIFGVLMVSFLVVFINSLLLIISDHITKALYLKIALPKDIGEKRYVVYWKVTHEKPSHYIADPRAPPPHLSLPQSLPLA
jgi:apolipoprotein N-acyltransferase